MTKECLCGMAISKIQSNLQGMRTDLMFAKTNAKVSERVYLHKEDLLVRIDDIERGSKHTVVNCNIPISFSNNVEYHTKSMEDIVKKKTYSHGDVIELEHEINIIEDLLDTNLKGCAKK